MAISQRNNLLQFYMTVVVHGSLFRFSADSSASRKLLTSRRELKGSKSEMILQTANFKIIKVYKGSYSKTGIIIVY